MTPHGVLLAVLTFLFVATQALYLLSFAIDFYFHTRPVDWVDPADERALSPDMCPKIVLLYPVLRELEETMRTTLRALAKLEYPRDKFRIVAIPNRDDVQTSEYLRRLQHDFPFLEVLEIPPTQDASWNVVWDAWDRNEKAYWWRTGHRASVRDLPPKKTRQLIYAFYTLLRQEGNNDWILNYIDADSVPPSRHFLAGAAGMRHFDVVQSTNVAGNLLDTWAASWHAMDHMTWDGFKYPHMSAHGRHPFWVLGKGLFYKASDLDEIGSFNPWLAIEDPEVGMRLWANGKKLGIVADPLIEEVPLTLRHGITQRKRWVCGFLQSLHVPLRLMGLTFAERMKARLNFWPCLFLLVNAVGLPIGSWALVVFVSGSSPLPVGFAAVAAVNIAGLLVIMALIYRSTWKRTALVLERRRDRLRYMFRVNPIFLFVYWLIWAVPLVIGFQMFLRDRGQVWERTEKIDANHDLIRRRLSVDEGIVSLQSSDTGDWIATR